ncbi:hypothetical protein MY10362_005711 [Beauveria mimosiformis]
MAESRVLLIRSRETGEYYLPKGRKDIHESLEDAALRETWEETGVIAQLLPVGITTRATPSAAGGAGGAGGAAGAAGADPASCVTEPLAVAQRVTDGVLKIIFWFVAAADSFVSPEEGMQQEGEDFEALWVGWDKVRSTLTFEDDWRIAEAGITAVAATN